MDPRTGLDVFGKSLMLLPRFNPPSLSRAACISVTKTAYEAVSWLNVLVTSLSTRRHVLDSRLIHAGFVLDKVALVHKNR